MFDCRKGRKRRTAVSGCVCFVQKNRMHKKRLDPRREMSFIRTNHELVRTMVRSMQTEPQDNSYYALEKLRDLTHSEKFGAEGRLPTERALAETLNVGR